MKQVVIITAVFALCSCKPHVTNNETVDPKIDVKILEDRVEVRYQLPNEYYCVPRQNLIAQETLELKLENNHLISIENIKLSRLNFLASEGGIENSLVMLRGKDIITLEPPSDKSDSKYIIKIMRCADLFSSSIEHMTYILKLIIPKNNRKINGNKIDNDSADSGDILHDPQTLP